MRQDQAEYLRHHIYLGGDGAFYDILRLILWAEKSCIIQELYVEDLMLSYEDGSSEEPDGSAEFIDRALQTEDYPLLVTDLGEGDYELIDGRHRFWKALHLGQTTVKCYLIPEDLPIAALYFHPDDEINVV